MNKTILLDRLHEYIEANPAVLSAAFTIPGKGDITDTWCRPSSLGKCRRALAYKKLCPEKGAKLTAHDLLKFRFGDMIEELYMSIAEKAGFVANRQKEVKATIAGIEIVGHIDGTLIDEDMNQYIIDCKSCSAQAYEQLQRTGIGGVDITYLVQQNIYMHATGIKKCLLFYVNKNISRSIEIVLDYDERYITYSAVALSTVNAATSDSLPKRDYQPNDKGILPWQDAYCPFVTTCYPGVVVEFDKKNKPVYKIVNNGNILDDGGEMKCK